MADNGSESKETIAIRAELTDTDVMFTYLDDTNRRLLETLQLNGRISNQDLAKEIGISPSPCLQRRRRLEDVGVIQRYEARLDLTTICQHVIVVAEVTLNNNQLSADAKFREHLANMPIAVHAFAVSGTVDYFVIFYAPNIQFYQRATNEMIQDAKVVETLTSHIVLEPVKEFAGLPIDILAPQSSQRNVG